jgi:hypothetical protein
VLLIPYLQSWGNFNLSRRFGCAYEVHNYLDCSNVAPTFNKHAIKATLRRLSGMPPKAYG